ncbi:MAG TPA: kynureninase [Acetobacteraceae bacterium]
MDEQDELGPLRDQFYLPPGLIYLDGNSLGVLPRATAGRVQEVVSREWGRDLIQSWNKAGWFHQPQRVGDKIARLIGAARGEVMAADSTSLNLYKVLSVACGFARADAPRRQAILSERDNFPTDLYIAESVARQHGFELRLVEAEEITARLDGTVAVVVLTHVNYRSGHMHDMARMTAAAHAAGALMVWDLAHSAGAVEVDLMDCEADFAVGCGYKYLNGGPGAPAFLWLHPYHAARMDSEKLWQPLAGWMGHVVPFAFSPGYRPAAGALRFLCGTPSPIALAALESGVDALLEVEALGGMAALRAKSVALTDLFIRLVEQRCGGDGLRLLTPLDAARRGSQVSFRRHEGAYAIIQALIARGVVGDFREPGLMRFGFAPLYLRFIDVWDAVDHLAQVMWREEWRQPRFHRRTVVT